MTIVQWRWEKENSRDRLIEKPIGLYVDIVESFDLISEKQRFISMENNEKWLTTTDLISYSSFISADHLIRRKKKKKKKRTVTREDINVGINDRYFLVIY